MRALVALDKFKDSMAAAEACAIVGRELARIHPDWEVELAPLADGGDGFTAALCSAVNCRRISLPVTGPLGEPQTAEYGVLSVDHIPAGAMALLQTAVPRWETAERHPADCREVAVIELAAAAGLNLVPPDRRDPWRATTFGLGELIRDAAERGASLILIGLGGSATQDLGCGALAALGFRFSSAEGPAGERVAVPFPELWSRITSVTPPAASQWPTISLAVDVTSPLLGPEGAAAVFGQQKGLRPDRAPQLEAASARMADLMIRGLAARPELPQQAGSGAAGGSAFGLMAGLGAALVPGYDLVAAWLDLRSRMAKVDLVITGEGRFDESSRCGKGPGGISAEAGRQGKPCWIFAGSIKASPTAHERHFQISEPALPLAAALAAGPQNLAQAVRLACEDLNRTGALSAICGGPS
jgi:glycerate 2-kinase